MSTSPRQTVVVPINLGAASNFDRDVFPLSSYRQRDKLGKGDFLLDATLDEMLKITSMGTDPRQWEEVIATTKSRYDQLVVRCSPTVEDPLIVPSRLKLQQARLEERSKSKSPLQQVLNPRKTLSDYRAIRLFLDAATTLYKETRVRLPSRGYVSLGVYPSTEQIRTDSKNGQQRTVVSSSARRHGARWWYVLLRSTGSAIGRTSRWSSR